MNILKKATIKFHVEQITPMIHFQGGEYEAGIRASDLKPRFDVFLKKYWYDSENEENKQAIELYALPQSENKKQQTEKNEKIAFDYKVKIINDEKDDSITFYKIKDKNKKPIFFGSFYGDLGDRENSFYRNITVTFISQHLELREKIKELFPVFLSVTGFGLRNNKGYGYFKIKEKKDTEIIKDIKKYQELVKRHANHIRGEGVGIYQLEIINKSSKNRIDEVLTNIKLFHQVLKSGLNKGYIPSFMLKEAKKEEGATLEKKILKLFLKKNNFDISALTNKGDVKINDDYDTLDKEKFYYVRGLLGLAPFYQFNKVIKNEERVKRSKKVVFTLKIDDVERFASPIQYLPLSHEKVMLLVDYGKIADFRKNASRVEFSLKEVNNTTNLKVQAMVPNEEQYSIHQFFQESGVIAKKLSQYEKLKHITYKVISDIEN